MIHIVLYQPEIPQNTGNIMRTCTATNAMLHLIEPLGFSLNEKHLRRSGLDYRDLCVYQIHPNWQDFTQKHPGQYYFVTRYGKKPHSELNFLESGEDIFLIFGRESTGIPKSILRDHLDTCMRIPMMPDARSLNLSNAVAIVIYEVLRQLGYPHLSKSEVLKGEDWLERDV
jgi:tRNA (cytidine/uridine-2'-O-)-methyltransferase